MSNRFSEKGSISIEAASRTADADSMEPRRKAESIVMRPQLGDASETERERSHVERSLIWLVGALVVVAVLGSALLLLADAGPQLAALFRLLIELAPRAWAWLGHAPLSALPLLLSGASYIALQALLRPAPMELVRRLMLGSAFLLWGIVQLMPPSELATDLGDLVIALYVFDLGLMIQAELQGHLQ